MSHVRRPDLYATYSIDPEYEKPEERMAAYNGLQEALKTAREEGDATREADVLYLSAHLCVEMKDYKKASTLFKKALNIYKKSTDRKAIADTLEWLGHLSWPYKNPAWPHSRWNEAPQYYKKALTYYAEEDPACIEILLPLIRALIHRENIITTHTTLRQAAAWCGKYQYPGGNGDIYAALAHIYSHEDDTINMWEFYEKAVKAFRISGDREKLVETLEGAIKDFSEKEIYRHALYFAKALLTEHKKSGDGVDMGSVYCDLADIYKKMEDYPEAITNFRESIKWFEKETEKGMLVMLYHDLGVALHDNEELEESMLWYKKALAIAEEENNQFMLGLIHHDMGIYYQFEEQWTEALEHYNKALQWKQKEEGNVGVTFLQMAIVYEEMKDLDKTLEALEKARDHYASSGPVKPHLLQNIQRVKKLIAARDQPPK